MPAKVSKTAALQKPEFHGYEFLGPYVLAIVLLPLLLTMSQTRRIYHLIRPAHRLLPLNSLLQRYLWLPCPINPLPLNLDH
jgi:hypothetical protein